ncbi:hypothetical protein, partial [Lacrimispora sp.]|uniref:hypothetical protein n=1 Tax=Lacrimispora sp. TaxID=2719234 RepID=UPI0032E523D3
VVLSAKSQKNFTIALDFLLVLMACFSSIFQRAICCYAQNREDRNIGKEDRVKKRVIYAGFS